MIRHGTSLQASTLSSGHFLAELILMAMVRVEAPKARLKHIYNSVEKMFQAYRFLNTKLFIYTYFSSIHIFFTTVHQEPLYLLVGPNPFEAGCHTNFSIVTLESYCINLFNLPHCAIFNAHNKNIH